MTGTYDPELNTLYWTTSNAAPDFVGDSRPGDDLYTACVLALDADSGELKWYFQFTPHDLYDYDATETPVLIDTQENGAAETSFSRRLTGTVISMFSTAPMANFFTRPRLSRS